MERNRQFRSTGELIQEARRNAERNPLELMREMISQHLGLDYLKPLPWLALILVNHTMPMPNTNDGSTIDVATVYPRVPVHLTTNLPKIINPGMTIDMGYARRRGHLMPLYVMCDGIMVDDMETAGTKIKTPDDRLSKAVSAVAKTGEVRLRCWSLTGGAIIWNELERETRQFERQAKLKPGTIQALVKGAEKTSPEEWATTEGDYLKALREYGRRGHGNC